MTAPSVRVSGSGFRYCSVYALDGSGFPAATSTTVYEGVQAEGAKTLELNEPEPRIIPISGDDRLYAQDALPAGEGMNGTLSIARSNMALEALVRSVINFTVGEAKGVVSGITDESGNEPQCGVMAYRQALTEAGARVYESVVLPRALLFSRQSGYTDSAAEYQFSVIPQLVTKHLWGTALAAGTEGATQAQAIRFVTQYKPYIVAWKADGTETEFLFATARQAPATTKIHGVWINGTVDASCGLAVSKITPTTKPSANDLVVCFYEVA